MPNTLDRFVKGQVPPVSYLRGNIPYIKRMLDEIDGNIVRALEAGGRQTLIEISDTLDELLQRMGVESERVPE